MIKKVVLIIVIASIYGCTKKEQRLFDTYSADHFNIEFKNTLTETNDLNILDYLYFYNGGGVAIGDINNDNLPDIFFSGNQVKNQLYLNKGNLQFENITQKAGVSGKSTWNTGSVMGDVNGDGLLDIYVCTVVGINGFDGYNELYINNGDETFTESASQYGLDFDTYSSSAAFLDYDLDGDLDIYLLNHAVHTQESFGKADLRYKRNDQSGDKLLRNDGEKFTDVSEEAGIYGGVNGYGLGVCVADFNQDGNPDIYVGNDFHEDDYYYLNNGDGTFTESLKKYFGHTSRFSMGNDVADINGDGWMDILSLDMLPEKETVLKTSEGDDNIQVQNLRTKRFGYYYQFTRNMLYVNQQHKHYAETALLSGIAATDWSWSGLFADFNQDEKQDLFISNGIVKRPNDLDFIKFVSSEQIQKKINTTKLVDQKALQMMPSGAIGNYIFKGEDDLVFKDQSKHWIANDTIVSGATAIGDLDNDGDLDIVTNNINNPPTFYINTTNTKSNYLILKFNYSKPNTLGIGTKAYLYYKNKLQYKELYTARGYQASSQPILHFGLDTIKMVDSLKIIWPNKTYQILKNVELNKTLTIKPEDTKPISKELNFEKQNLLFEKVENNLGITFAHHEDAYIDFTRQKLIPYRISDRGPATAIGDLNNDAKDDVFFGGSKYRPSTIYTQTDLGFEQLNRSSITKDSIYENTTAIINDFNSNGFNDVFIGNAGGDFNNKHKQLANNYYAIKNTDYIAKSLPENFQNTAIAIENDIDNDGDLDIFVGNYAVTNDFGAFSDSYILKNDKGNLVNSQKESLQDLGMITDAIWDDYNNDGIKDLIVVGEWMPPKFFKNEKGKLIEEQPFNENLNGLWQRIVPFDMDGDGDTDYILGNWGTNTKFKATPNNPMKMYYADFDNNGSTETIVTIKKAGNYYPLLGLDELTSQIVSLRKKYNSYKSFAGERVEDIFDKKTLQDATILKVHTLLSGYLKNNDGKFTFIPFKNELQLSPITALLVYDFDKDGKKEVLVAGNYFGTTPYHGRFDSFSGALIKNEKNITLGHQIGLDIFNKAVRHLNIIKVKNKPYLLATINNDNVQVYKLNEYNDEAD